LKAANPEAGNLRLWVNGQDLTAGRQRAAWRSQTEGLPAACWHQVQMGIW
jgi:hypothetical protein